MTSSVNTLLSLYLLDKNNLPAKNYLMIIVFLFLKFK